MFVRHDTSSHSGVTDARERLGQGNAISRGNKSLNEGNLAWTRH